MSIIIHSARIVSGGSTTDDAWVAFGDRIVVARGIGSGWRELQRAGTAVTDASGLWLTPGFVDIHCHGGGGAAFDDGAAAIRAALAMHRAHGTTRSVLSLVTAPLDQLVSRLEAVARLADRDPLVLGAHLEGPFLAQGFHGAHDSSLLLAPEPDDIVRLLAAGSGWLRQVTLAPELPGAAEAIRILRAAGVVVAIGHTACDYRQARTAFTAGASILTHAFNGMRGLHHRLPGPVAAATSMDGVVLEVINDGVHVHGEVVRMLFAAAPRRIALVTDAMAAAGADDGDYALGGLGVTVVNGVARLREGGSIAGSTLTLDDCLRRAVTEVGIGIEAAVTALTETPARAIGRPDLGRLEAGSPADAVLLDEEFRVGAVWAEGDRLV